METLLRPTKGGSGREIMVLHSMNGGSRGWGYLASLSRTQGIYDWARDKDDRARDKDEQTGLRENAHLHRGVVAGTRVIWRRVE